MTSVLAEQTSVVRNSILDDEWHCLRFGIKTSLRYHERRRAFFRNWNTVTKVLTILTGSAVFSMAVSEKSNSTLFAISGITVAILTTIDLVVGFSDRARDHYDLNKRFSAVLASMNRIGDGPTAAQLADHKNQRIDIEADEPPHLTVLNLRCHNDQIRADGHGRSQLVKIGFVQRLCSHFIDISADGLLKEADRMKGSE